MVAFAGELAYGEWRGDEPAVVLVPGIFATHLSIAALARRIAPARRVLAFDLRGRGRSTLDGPFGIERHADDLWAALDALGVHDPLLVGHSLGAFVVATAAAARPVDVVLLDGGLWAPYPVPVELVHQVFAEDRARLGRTYAVLQEYDDERDEDEVAYELVAVGNRLRPVMPVAAFDEDVASIAAHVGGNGPLGASGGRVLAIRALQGINQMLPDATIADARAAIPSLRVVDMPDATHGGIVREPAAARVAMEVLRA